MTVHVTSVPALILLIIIAYGHQDSAVFQQGSCQATRSLFDIVKYLSCVTAFTSLDRSI